MKYVLATGGFDPIHSGHIDYFNAAKKLGDKLVVGVNTDEWLSRKKGKPFMSFQERLNIISNLKMVDKVIAFDDSNGTANRAIFKLKCLITLEDSIIFVNGGDREITNTPELDFWKDDPQVEFCFGVGGDYKKNSSSILLNNWDKEFCFRDWGNWSVLKEYPYIKVKELIVKPNHSLSMQRHFHRSELWFVAEGIATIGSINISSDYEERQVYTNSVFSIKKEEWHQLKNTHTTPLKIIEIQYGDLCEEDDIERK